MDQTLGARVLLQGMALQSDPDPEQVLHAIASLPAPADPASDLSIAIAAARAVAAATEARVKAANTSTNQPDDDEWAAIVTLFGLDDSFRYCPADQLQYARAYRALR
jgi:hypothetical protein